MKRVFDCFPQGSAEYVVFHACYMMRKKRKPSATLFMKSCCANDHRLLGADKNPIVALKKAVYVLTQSNSVAIYPGFHEKVVKCAATINYVMDLLGVDNFFVPSTYTTEEKAKIAKDLDLIPGKENKVA